MIKLLRLTELIAPLKGELIGSDVSFSRVSTDTRSIQSGDLFVALKGENFDAHDFINDALAAGASAAVVDRAVDSVDAPQLKVDDTTLALGDLARLNRQVFTKSVVALTGSAGKTTVKEMLATLLSGAGQVHVTQGNLNNHIGVPQTLLALDDSADFAVIEMGASGLGEIDYLAGIAEPNVALVNNVLPAHLEGFGSERAIADEKSAIYRKLREGGTAVINLDEPYSAQWQQQLSETRKDIQQIGFSAENSSADVYAKDIRSTPTGGYQFQLCVGAEQALVSLPLLGRQNVNNALAACACALSVGLPLTTIVKQLPQVSPYKGRLVAKVGQRDSLVIDDTYNANPGSVLAAARVLVDLQASTKRTILALGDLGELGANEAVILNQLGKDLAGLGLSELYTQGKNSALVSAAFSKWANTQAENVKHFLTQDELAHHLSTLLTDNTVVLVKGSRGARMEHVVQAITLGGEQ